LFFSNIHTQIFIYFLKRGKSKQNRVNVENAKLRWAAARAAAAAPQNGPGGPGAQQIAAIAAAVIEPEAVQPQGHAHGKQ